MIEIGFSVLTAILLFFTLAPISRKEVWWIRGLDFPRLQFAIISVLLIVAEIILLDFTSSLSWIILSLTIFCAAYQSWWILPYTKLFKKEVKDATAAGKNSSFRLLISNVLQSNRQYHLLLERIESENPDFIATLETNTWWQEKLDVLEEKYPHRINCPMENRYGMHVFSKHPLFDSDIAFLIEENVPSISTFIELPTGSKIKIFIVHPAPPSPTENDESTERDAELVLIAKKSKECEVPVIVTGDLNDVAWSYTTRLFRKISNLLDPRVGRGMYNSFHAEHLFMRWPLDHLFHSEHFQLSKIKRLEPIGSDHFPMLMDLVILPNSNQNEESLEATEEDEEIAEDKLNKKGVDESLNK